MAKSKDDIKYGTAQAKLSEHESLRSGYVGGTPLEAGKIADSEFVDLYSAAGNIATAQQQNPAHSQSEDPTVEKGDGVGSSNGENRVYLDVIPDKIYTK